MPDQEQLHTAAMLSAMGKSTRQIAPIVGRDHTTVWRWLEQHDTQRLINEYRPAIAARLSQRMWDLIDNDSFNVSPQQLAVIWGIAMDKHDKAQEPSHSNPTLVIVIPGIQEPVTIEGQVASNPEPSHL